MEKLTINIPDKKSSLVKQILKGLGVTIEAGIVRIATREAHRHDIRLAMPVHAPRLIVDRQAENVDTGVLHLAKPDLLRRGLLLRGALQRRRRS